jgi:class 3 adenylate cyclase/tetratricopeptide (TPR) repeat protein
MRCPSCQTENEAGRKFCGECGAPLAQLCPSCGAANSPGVKFCGECGTALTAAPAPAAVQPTAERRLVSVLFADLVGFTAASEGRDSEETRELLSRYFETARTLIERYGGAVEKFIGDAVMAVWGTPVAQEDDAERAVRTALDLVAAVPELDAGLHARAGVLTGEAAVTVGAQGQGMVAGDLVNTASRIQSAAPPGTVLVGEATKRATEAAVAYEDAGEHELKGKESPERLSRAVRVLSARGGALRSDGLEPPFVGRDRELRLVKELFHAASEQRKAHLVSVVGIAGIGKSRIAWEFEKYIDGLVEQVAWHRGRCLAYGEGVAYWALAEMVRMRARITEEESTGEAGAKLRATLVEHVPDEEERAWLEPRLAHLLGLGDPIAAEREELFSAWRLFFERLADEGACALVFEDLQWAEPGLLDFVDHLLEWSRNHPIFVLALQRPDLAERGLTLAAASRNATTLALEPLRQPAMEQLLDGFVPGLPDDLRAGILERAEGIPLYAVETVRMLLDRGLVVREGSVYRPTGPIEALAVPETLHALLAARLDGLDPDERALVQDAAVLGKTFTKQGLAAVSGRSDTDIEKLLTRLVRKEVFSLQADPRSPERGQYGFLQDLLKRVAYETLSKRERKGRHLAAAAYLATAWADEQEIVEVVASHYVDAYRLDPDAEDAAEIKRQARDALTRAGERAASLAATEEAARVFTAAAELTDGALEEAELRMKAGRAAYDGVAFEAAAAALERANELYGAAGSSRESAVALALLGNTEWQMHRGERAIERMEEGLAALAGAEPDEGVAALAAELARAYFFRGDLEAAQERVEQAIDLAEELWVPEVLSNALNTAGLIAGFRGRPEYGLALIRHSLDIALENDLARVALRAYINLSDRMDARDRWDEARAIQERGLALARRVGSRAGELRFLGEMGWALLNQGSWDEAEAIAQRIPEEGDVVGAGILLVFELTLRRGDLDLARAHLARLKAAYDPGDAQDSVAYHLMQAEFFNAQGLHDQALAVARQAVADLRGSGVHAAQGKMAYIEALRAAHALGDERGVRQVLAELEAQPPGLLPPMLRAHILWYRALVGDEPEQRFKAAAALLREYAMVPLGALVEVDHAAWLVGAGRPDDARPILDEAREVFERIGARPWLERCDAVEERLATIAAPAT